MADIQSEVLQKLKCSVCESYLSCSPVMQKVNGDSICGRCVTADNIEHSTIRQKSYEALASIHSFPCRYDNNGCSQILPWDDVREHEEDCSYRPYECFLLPPGSCTWSGFRNQLMEHYRNDHSTQIMDIATEMQIDLSEDVEMNNITTIFDSLFLVQLKYVKISNKMFHTVRYIGNAKCSKLFKYNFTIITADEDITKKRNVEPHICLYACSDISHKIEFDGSLQYEQVAVKICIDKKFEPNISKPTKCLVCKQNLNSFYTCQTKDGCYCTQCVPDNYVLVDTIRGKSTSKRIISCNMCLLKEYEENIGRHKKWFCSAIKNFCSICPKLKDGYHNQFPEILRHYENNHVIDSRKGISWKSICYLECKTTLVGTLLSNNVVFFIFTKFSNVELYVQIVSRVQTTDFKYLKCEISVSNYENKLSVLKVPKIGKDCDWEAHFKNNIQNPIIQKKIEQGTVKDLCDLTVTITKTV